MFSTLIAACCLIGGTVHAASGSTLAGVALVLRGATTQTLVSDVAGTFRAHAEPGSYDLTAVAAGYAPLTITLRAEHDTTLDVTLEPLDSPQLRQIGQVTVDGRLAPIRGTIPNIALSRATLDSLGFDRVTQGLAQLPGATFARPDGGAAAAVSVVALRGPDPSETLIALDGQLLSDGNTGDLDLSRLPVAAFSALEVTEGLGPLDTSGSNTIGGAIDLLSLRPTKRAHQALSLSSGSFGRNDGWLNATGTRGRLGYALALDDQHEAGFVDRSDSLYSTSDPTCAPCSTHLGSYVAERAALATLTWSFSQNAELAARVFTLGDVRDQSSSVNGIDRRAADRGSPTYGALVGPGRQTFAQAIRAYQLRGRAPLGAGELSGELSASDDSIAVAGGATTPYDLVHRDRRYNGALAWQRAFPTSHYAVGGYTRYEQLAFDAPDGTQPLLGQTIDVLFARGGFDLVPKLRVDGGIFESRYTTFGSNLDGRLSAVYGVSPVTSIRFSVGTGFRAPLLIERYRFPYSQLALDANDVFVGQGSTGELPEHATEYELGLSHEFSTRATIDISLYQTSLRNPIEVFYPLAAVDGGTCTMNSYALPNPKCVSLQSNVGNAVYRGAEFRYSQLFIASHLLLTGRYGINIAYPRSFNANFSNPTSGGTLVDNAQFLGIPQQQGSLQLAYDESRWHAAVAVSARGKNNELNQGPFAVVHALAGRRIGSLVDLSLSATNVFNAEAGAFTQLGAGEPYRGIAGRDAAGAPRYGSLATDARFIEPAALRLIMTVRN